MLTERKCDMIKNAKGVPRMKGVRGCVRNVRVGVKTMIVLHGKGVSGGIAEGTLVFWRRKNGRVPRYRTEEWEAEWNRFLHARETVADGLKGLAEASRSAGCGEAGEAAPGTAWLWEAHCLIAEDPEYGAEVEKAVRERHMNAEAAVEDVSAEFAGRLERAEDEYIRARAADVRDVSARLIAALLGEPGSDGGDSDTRMFSEGGPDTRILRGGSPDTRALSGSSPDTRILSGGGPDTQAFGAETAGTGEVPGSFILAADDLTPGEALQLDRAKIAGLIAAGGSAVSHTAILARTMGLAAIVGAGDVLRPELEGQPVLMDGEDGEIVIAPDDRTRERYAGKAEQKQAARAGLEELRHKPSMTGDGRIIRVCCNISLPDDVESVLDSGADGIGLFRSECLFLGRDALMPEEEQFLAYRRVLEAMGEKEVTIRTLDAGSDKQLAGLTIPDEANPAMGLRGLRASLAYPEIFRTQLRALYRASGYGKLRIMFPMVTSVWELREAKQICSRVRKELEAEGVPGIVEVPVGIMIETPAAALMSGELAAEADFFSCGTNDLTQYTLACDRQNGSLERYYDPRHPAVLRLLAMTAENARKAGIRVGVCGELAADREMAEFWLSAGIDELSVPPRSVLPLRERFSELSEGK